MTYSELLGGKAWRAIRGCPGRHVRAEPDPELDGWVSEHGRAVAASGTADPVRIAPLDDGGGLLSYAKADGRFVHTLNTPDGFARKLRALGVEPA
jgi:hypothetical protein